MRLVHAVLILSLIGSPAFAATKAKKAAAPAQAPKSDAKTDTRTRAVFNPDGSFGFCLGEHPYADGRKLTIAQSPTNQINVGFTIPKAGFQIGAKYDLMLGLDGEEPRKNRAQAIEENAVLLQMGANPKFRQKLSIARSLTVGAKGKMISFDLPTMQPFLGSLDTCIKDNKNKTNAKAAGGGKDLPDTLKALLVAAGFMDVISMDLSKIPVDERPADYVWQTGRLLAGIRERRAPEDKTLSDLVSMHLQGLKSRCNGAFKTNIEREKKVKGLTLTLADATCTPSDISKEPAIVVAALFYLTPRGGFTVFTHEGHKDVKDEAIAARDKLAATIIDIANQEPVEKR